MSANETIAVRVLDSAVSHDARLVDQLTGLINGVYATAESGLWRDGTTRTTASELGELVGAGQIAVATRDGQMAPSASMTSRTTRASSECWSPLPISAALMSVAPS